MQTKKCGLNTTTEHFFRINSGKIAKECVCIVIVRNPHDISKHNRKTTIWYIFLWKSDTVFSLCVVLQLNFSNFCFMKHHNGPFMWILCFVRIFNVLSTKKLSYKIKGNINFIARYSGYVWWKQYYEKLHSLLSHIFIKLPWIRDKRPVCGT